MHVLISLETLYGVARRWVPQQPVWAVLVRTTPAAEESINDFGLPGSPVPEPIPAHAHLKHKTTLSHPERLRIYSPRYLTTSSGQEQCQTTLALIVTVRSSTVTQCSTRLSASSPVSSHVDMTISYCCASGVRSPKMKVVLITSETMVYPPQ